MNKVQYFSKKKKFLFFFQKKKGMIKTFQFRNKKSKKIQDILTYFDIRLDEKKKKNSKTHMILDISRKKRKENNNIVYWYIDIYPKIKKLLKKHSTSYLVQNYPAGMINRDPKTKNIQVILPTSIRPQGQAQYLSEKNIVESIEHVDDLFVDKKEYENMERKFAQKTQIQFIPQQDNEFFQYGKKSLPSTQKEMPHSFVAKMQVLQDFIKNFKNSST